MMNRLRHLYSLTFALAALTLLLRASPASANNCLKDEFGKNVQCTANDVSVAKATNIRALDGSALKSCNIGTTFSFVADFLVVTTATARENIGLYFATAGQSTALTGTCSANIISPLHASSNPLDSVMLGTSQYESLDAAPDNCGDISTSDNNQVITVEVDNVVCQAAVGTNQLSLPDCTSWQQPGGTIQCVSPAPSYPWVPAAVPGAPSKCSCNAGFTVPITVQSAAVSVTKTPSPTSLPDGGGPVTYTVAIQNNSNFGNITVNQICDDQYGNIATAVTNPAQPACATGKTGSVSGTPSCALPQTIATGASYSCTFTGNTPEAGNVAGANPAKFNDTVIINGLAQNGTTPISGTANASVTIAEAPATANVIKTSASVMPTSGCATVRYGVEVENTTGLTTDETESLSALTDTTYGDITTVQGNVLGTTCAATGKGTLSGAGAGALPTTIAVGGNYTCQFDAQVCGNTKALSTTAAPPNATNCPAGLEVTDTVSGTLVGDESETVSQTPGTLTVDVCFATSEVTK
jgi:hypothetical protein